MKWKQLTNEEVKAWDSQKILICTTDGEDLSVNALSEITGDKSDRCDLREAGIEPDGQGKYDNLTVMDWRLSGVSSNKLQVIFIDESGLPFKPIWLDPAPSTPL